MSMTTILQAAEAAVIPEPDTKPILRWEPAPYSNGKSVVADKQIDLGSDMRLGFFGANVKPFFQARYHVRRSSPRSRLWQAKRNGEYFDKALYASKELAMKACEDDAKSPKTRLKDRKHEVLA